MKPNHIIWSGCSFTFGSGFINEEDQYIRDENQKPVFMHPLLEEKYGWKTVKEAKEGVKQISYPHKVAKELGISSYNLAIQGFGIDSHIQKVTAFILENKYNIDFEGGDAIVMFQVADFSRMEFWFNKFNNKVGLSGAGAPEDHPSFLKEFLVHSYNDVYQTYKYILDLIRFKGFCKSRGINFHPYSFDGDYLRQLDERIEDDDYWRNLIPKVWEHWEHEKTVLPRMKDLIKELNPLPINPYKYAWDDEGSVHHCTFVGEYKGYNDGHFTERGHELLSKGILEFLTQEYNYGKH